jgi:hypothetical protein
METIKIPPAIILEAMLKKLPFYFPKDESHAIGGSFFQIDVMFYSSACFPQSSLHPHSDFSHPTLSLKKAALSSSSPLSEHDYAHRRGEGQRRRPFSSPLRARVASFATASSSSLRM